MLTRTRHFLARQQQQPQQDGHVYRPCRSGKKRRDTKRTCWAYLRWILLEWAGRMGAFTFGPVVLSVMAMIHGAW